MGPARLERATSCSGGKNQTSGTVWADKCLVDLQGLTCLKKFGPSGWIW